MPNPGRRGNTRRILIITVSVTVAAVLTVMALFAKSSQGYAVLLGYAILIMSAVLANHMIATSASDMRRMALLVLSVGILILFLGSLALIPFAPETTEETAPSPAVEAADENLTMGGHDRAFITLSSSDTAASVHGEEEGTAEPISSARTSRAVIWGIALPLLIAAIAGTAAAAFEPCTICLIPMTCIVKLLEENAELGLFFIRQLSIDLGISDERTVSLTQKHIRGRLAESLLFLKDTYGVEEDQCTLSIYLSREDLANLSNMTTSNAIRTLSNFASEKLIIIDGRKIKLIDEEKLKKISKIG